MPEETVIPAEGASYTLSGGNYGGEVRLFTEPTLVIEDEQGFWTYDYSRHPKTKTADLVSFEPKE